MLEIKKRRKLPPTLVPYTYILPMPITLSLIYLLNRIFQSWILLFRTSNLQRAQPCRAVVTRRLPEEHQQGWFVWRTHHLSTASEFDLNQSASTSPFLQRALKPTEEKDLAGVSGSAFP